EDISISPVVPRVEELLNLNIRRSARLAAKKQVNMNEKVNEFKTTEKVYHKQPPKYHFPRLTQAESKRLQKELGDDSFKEDINLINFQKFQNSGFIKKIRNAMEAYQLAGKKGLRSFDLAPRQASAVKHGKYSISGDDLLYRQIDDELKVPVVPEAHRLRIVKYFHTSN
ncbi:MAG: hypothetical protein GY755_03935, partial [Chloroflexi bacterium]|nr:hypothetical protein [Chloroflexota bacterium]